MIKIGNAGNLAGLTDEVFPFSAAFRQLVTEVEKVNPTTSSPLVVDLSNQKEPAMKFKPGVFETRVIV